MHFIYYWALGIILIRFCYYKLKISQNIVVEFKILPKEYIYIYYS